MFRVIIFLSFLFSFTASADVEKVLAEGTLASIPDNAKFCVTALGSGSDTMIVCDDKIRISRLTDFTSESRGSRTSAYSFKLMQMGFKSQGCYPYTYSNGIGDNLSMHTTTYCNYSR